MTTTCEICQEYTGAASVWVRGDATSKIAHLIHYCTKCFESCLGTDGMVTIVATEPDQEPRTTEMACCFRFTTCDVMGTLLNDEPAVTLARLGQFESWSPGQAMAIAAAIVAAARFAAKPK